MPRLYTTVTQGGADAFAQAELATALAGVKGIAYLVKGIRFEFILPAVAAFPLGVAASQDLQLTLTRRTKAAAPTLADPDLIHKFKWAGIYSTAVSWSPIFDVAGIYKPEGEILVVEDPLYVQIDSTGTGGIWSAVLAIDYETQKISDIDRLSLLTLSLS